MSSGSNSHFEVMHRIGLASSVTDRLSRDLVTAASKPHHEIQATLQLHSRGHRLSLCTYAG